MPKTRLQKEEILAKLTDRLERAQSVVFLSLSGIKVEELETLREKFFAAGLQLQVPKNTILRKVLADTKQTVPTELLDQPLALVFSYEDGIAGPKTVAPFIKEIDKLVVLGGMMDGAFLEPAQVEAIAKLPSREQLLGQLVGVLQGPISGLVNVMAGNLRGLVTVLTAVRDQKA